ncbi:MAG: alanine racemase [Balneolaceae bacterium]|nr:alanine racemase [Balneolaceae bacterium]
MNSYLEVDLSAIRHNVQVLKSYTSPEVKLMAVVKADAYGHGSRQVAKALQERADWLAVNSVEEGVELRGAGISLPILVFSVPDDKTAPAYPEYALTASISALSHFGRLLPGTEYHLNIDTGMGRLGIRPDEVTAARKKMQEYQELTCTGIYSHFATADDPASAKAEKQLELFRAARSEFDETLLTHMANTGGTAFYSSSHFDMVRTGIGIYGYPPGRMLIHGLEPALRWGSELVQIKRVQKGDSVSYGARWHAPEEGYVGVVPVGYEEGISRLLSGNLEIAVNGELYPVAGTVTMNYVVLFLGAATTCSEGDEVEILGGHSLTAGEWARRTGTIPYEIVTGISGRVPRIYKDD